jgi:hypothetical protein
MNSRVIIFSVLFLAFITVMIFAFGGRERESKPAEQTIVQITGIVRLVGSSNFPELIISDSHDSWVIISDEIYKLHDLQHRTVTIEGEETVTELRFANGLPAGTRRELRYVRIISVE